MTTLYWGGGSGTWGAFIPTNWYTDVGRTIPSTRAPCAEDDVVFDSASNATSYIVTFSPDADGAACCKSVTVAGPAAGTVAFGGGTSGSLYIYGDVVFPSTGMVVAGGFAVRCSGVGTLNIGVSLTGLYTPFFITGTYTLAAALTTGYGNVNLFSGSLNTNNYNLTASYIALTGTGTLNCTTSTITTNFIQNAASDPITVASANFIFTGTSISIGAPGLAGTTYNDVTFSSLTGGQSGPRFYGENTFNNLNFGTLSTSVIGPTGVTFYADQVVTGTLTVSGQNGSNRVYFKSSKIGETRTFTVAAVSSLTDVDFRDITVTGAAAPFSGTRLGDGGGNSGVTFPTPKTVYWNRTAGGSWYGDFWAATSGGAVAIANYPLPQDSVIIDNTGLNASASISANYGAWLTSLTSTKTNAFNLSAELTVYGNVTLTASIGANKSFNFCGRAAQTLTTAGSSVYTCTVCTAGSTVSLADNLTAAALNFASGGFDTTNKNITTTGTGIYFSNENTGISPPTIDVTLGSSVISVTGSNFYSYIFGAVDITYEFVITLDAGTSSITSSISNASIVFGCIGQSLTFNSVTLPFNGSSINYYGDNTFNNLTFGAATSLGTSQTHTLYGDITVSGTLALVGGTSANQRLGVYSNTPDTQRTITAATVTGLTDIDFRDIMGAGAASWSGTRLGDGGGNDGITFAAPKTVYWNLGGSVSWTATGWATTSGGSPAAVNYPLPQDTAVFNDAGTASTVSIDTKISVGTIDMSARTSAMTLGGYFAVSVTGDITLSSAMTLTYQGDMYFRGTNSQTLTTAGKTITFSISIYNPSCNFLHGDAFISSSGFMTIYYGNYSTQNFNITLQNGINTYLSSPKNINLGTSVLTCGTTIIFDSTGYSNAPLTFNGASASLIIPNSAVTTATLSLGGNSLGSVLNNSAQQLLVSSNAIIGTLTSTSTGNLTVASGVTLAVTTFNYTGSFSNVVKVYAETPGQQARIGSFSGNVGVNSTDGGNNKGLTFAGTSPNYLYVKDILGPSAYNSATNFLPFF